MRFAPRRRVLICLGVDPLNLGAKASELCSQDIDLGAHGLACLGHNLRDDLLNLGIAQRRWPDERRDGEQYLDPELQIVAPDFLPEDIPQGLRCALEELLLVRGPLT